VARELEPLKTPRSTTSAKPVDNHVSEPMGYFRFHRRFTSRILGNERTIAVYLPPGYARSAHHVYPVLYLHDGQNLFDPGTAAFGVDWHAHITSDRLVNSHKIIPVIMVGVYNTPQRISEYTPYFDPRRQDGGDGEKYVSFLVEELKPFIDHQYRTIPSRDYTAVAGSSLGGLISLCCVRWRPDVFSACAALSPSLWWMETQLFADWAQDLEWVKKARFWIDMGTHETHSSHENQAGVERCQRFVNLLRSAGRSEGKDFEFSTIEGAGHSESAWGARFDRVLSFLFGV
jgi:predicted alpha/beta superfamily hydrolase